MVPPARLEVYTFLKVYILMSCHLIRNARVNPLANKIIYSVLDEC